LTPTPQAAGDAASSAATSGRRPTDDIARLALADLSTADFQREVLNRAVAALAAPAAAIWTRTDQGNFQQALLLNPGKLALDREDDEEGRRAHDELLRKVIQQARPVAVPGRATEDEETAQPTLLAVPVIVDDQVTALVEVFQSPTLDQVEAQGKLLYLVRLADLMTVFVLRQRERTETGEAELWAKIDAFAKRVHASLNPTEVSYRLANEGRQLVGGDRLSVVLRSGRKATVESVSGVEAVDQRGNLVRRLRRLSDRVLDWGETLIFRGTRDDSLPPDVLQDLDLYLEESHAKLLVVLPLREPHDGKGKPPRPRSALLLECFETALPAEQLLARLETLAPHAATALGNALDHKQIPLRFLWRPIAAVQKGLGGKTKAIVGSIAAVLVFVVGMLFFCPYPLKMDAKGQLLPVERRWVYSPVEGQVVRFAEGIETGKAVAENQSLILLYDVQLETKIVQLAAEVRAAQQDVEALGKQFSTAPTEADRLRISSEKKQKEAIRDKKFWELRTLRERTHADAAKPGYFWLKSPLRGTVLNADFKETLTNRQVKPSEPLLRIGDKDRAWDVELKIPQKHMGHIVQAFAAVEGHELDVDLLVLSEPTRIYKGKLSRDRLAGEATPHKEETHANEAEPVVLAGVRIDGDDIAEEDRIPSDLLITGTEVHAKVRCGQAALGYSLFHGVWEFFFEKVLFFF